MTMKKGWVAVAATVFVLSTSILCIPAIAAGDKDKKKTNANGAFNQLDKNNDGKLTKEEFAKFDHGKKKGKKAKKAADEFNRGDANNDGTISPEEFKKVYEHTRKK